MKYYRITKETDKLQKKGNHLLIVDAWIQNELYTEKELKKLAERNILIPMKIMEAVTISKNNTYFCFGARFEKEM